MFGVYISYRWQGVLIHDYPILWINATHDFAIEFCWHDTILHQITFIGSAQGESNVELTWLKPSSKPLVFLLHKPTNVKHMYDHPLPTTSTKRNNSSTFFTSLHFIPLSHLSPVKQTFILPWHKTGWISRYKFQWQGICLLNYVLKFTTRLHTNT